MVDEELEAQFSGALSSGTVATSRFGTGWQDKLENNRTRKYKQLAKFSAKQQGGRTQTGKGQMMTNCNA